MRRFVCARWFVTCVGLLACLLGDPGAAQSDSHAAIDVAVPVRGLPLGLRMDLLEDKTGSLTLEQVQRGPLSAHFRRSTEAAPSFGFTSSTYWIRFRVANSDERERAWLLELSYALLDYVTLYVPNEAGSYDARKTGDMLPFAQRDIAYRNFVFSLQEPAKSQRTYYFRVATSSAMNLPVIAWSTREFLEHQHLDWSLLCIFYGVILVMACYNACVYGFSKQREYLFYVAYIVSLALLEFTVAGHTFQFSLPNDPMLVHRLLPAFIAATLLFGSIVVVQTYSPTGHSQHRIKVAIVLSCCAVAALSFLLPFRFSREVISYCVMGVTLAGLLTALELLRVEGKRAKLFVLGWGSVIVGAVVSTLQTWGLLPQTFFTEWSVHIGATIQLVLVSSALADKLNTARADLAMVHGTLQHKVAQLSLALERAEEATARAQRAMRLKDEFMATMSHEFRTPLNPIINIPQEMRSEFTIGRQAACAECGSVFELDEGEQLGPEVACPECARVNCLVETRALHYVGDPSRTRKFLLKVERSGRHLLQVVNGILEFSKLEAGHRELSRGPIEVGLLVRGALESIREQATRRGQTIVCELAADDTVLEVDGQRIGQVLMNLLDNATKYSEQPGQVTLRGTLSERGYAFSVSDQGIGIARENFERIFKSFEQVHKGSTRRYGGTGLGLSIARSLVRLHGGDLTVESELGRGSTFLFDLPGAVQRSRSGHSQRPARAAGGSR